MSKLVIELQKECLNPKYSLSDLCQKAYFIARKLNQDEMIDFLKKEIYGYKNSKDLPDYRHVDLIYKAFNPYHGWIPFQIPSQGIFSKLLKGPIFLSVGEMQDFINADDPVLNTAVPLELQQELIKKSNMPFNTEIKGVFSKTQLVRILDAIKNRILDWALKLEEEGICDNEYEFTEHEKEIAKNMTVIINGNVNGSNIIDSMTNSSATINNNNSFDFETLKQLITKIEADLENAKNIETEKAASLKEQITLLKKSAEEQNETSAIDLLKSIVAGAISSGIWTIGSTITTFLSSLG